MATPSSHPPAKPSFKLISTREQKKQFDQAVKEVIRQRKGAQKGGKPPSSTPSSSQQNGSGGGARMAAIVQSREFEQLKMASSQHGPSSGGGGGEGGRISGMQHGSPSSSGISQTSERQRGTLRHHQPMLNYSLNSTGRGQGPRGQRRSTSPPPLGRAVGPKQGSRRSSAPDSIDSRRNLMNRSASVKSALTIPIELLESPPPSPSGKLKTPQDDKDVGRRGMDTEDVSRSPVTALGMASLTINAIGTGSRRGRNALALSIKSADLGGVIGGALGRGEISEGGLEEGLRAAEALLNEGREGDGEGKLRARPLRRGSIGDTPLIPACLPYPSMKGEGKELGKDGERVNQAPYHASTSSAESEGYKDFLDFCKDKDGRGTEGKRAGGRGRTNDEWGEQFKRTASVRRLDPQDIEKDLNNMGDIKLEDLIPTRRISRENSARSSDLAISDRTEPALSKEGGSRETIDMTREDETESPRRGGKQDLRSNPPGLGISLGSGEANKEVEEAEPDAGGGALGKAADCISDWGALLWSSGTLKSPPSGNNAKSLSRPSSSTTLNSFATARSRESSPVASLIRKPPSSSDHDHESSQDSCPRSQFVLMKSERKSNSGSGGTGKTQDTSTSTLFSSARSISENLAAIQIAPKNGGSDRKQNKNSASGNKSNFEAIKEEVKELRNSWNSRISEQNFSKSERRELASGDSFAEADGQGYDGSTLPGYGLYKQKKGGRMRRLRKGLKNSLRGTSSKNVKGERDYHEMDGGSQIGRSGSSTISAEQRERVSQHLQRSPSNRSVTSSFSSFSGLTGTSDASSTASGRLWGKFKLRKGRPKMPKAHSMHNVVAQRRMSGDDSVESGRCMSRSAHGSAHHSSSSSRPRLIGNRFDSNASNMSGLSSDDGSAFSRVTSTSMGFSDFYDHGDHVKAVSSLISSRAASGRSLASTLATVKEPPNEGGHSSVGGMSAEQKHDEDYHHRRESEQLSAYRRYSKAQGEDDSMNSFYRHPSHEHPLVHMRPNQLFPDSPGWQCDECCKETFDLSIWAYVSTEKNYLLCEECFTRNGLSLTT